MKPKKFYTARYDRVFKTILCNWDNPKIMKKILGSILEEEIESIEFQNSELPINDSLEKSKTVDVILKVKKKIIHVEVNIRMTSYLHTRNFAYFANVYGRNTRRGEKYENIEEFIHIDLTYGLGKKIKEKSVYSIQDEEGNKYIDNLKIIEYNMDKLKDDCYNHDKEKYKYLVMLDLEKEELDELAKGDEVVKEYRDKLVELNESDEFQSLMTYEEDQEKILNTEKSISFEEGKEQGKEQGINEEKIEVLKKLRQTDMDEESIKNILRITDEELNKLKEML